MQVRKWTALVSVGVLIAIGGLCNIARGQNMNDVLSKMKGRWVVDTDFMHEYFRQGSRIQEAWCGAGWSEEEIARRISVVQNAFAKTRIPVWDFSEVSEGRLLWKVFGQTDESTRTIYGCKVHHDDIFVCDRSPPIPEKYGKDMFRFDGEYLFAVIRMTPDEMQCELRSTSPSEVWIAPFRMKRESPR